MSTISIRFGAEITPLSVHAFEALSLVLQSSSVLLVSTFLADRICTLPLCVTLTGYSYAP